MVGSNVWSAVGVEEITGCEFGDKEGGKVETRADTVGAVVGLGDDGGVGVDVRGCIVGSGVTPKSGAITTAIKVVSLATRGSSSPSVPKVELFPGADSSVTQCVLGYGFEKDLSSICTYHSPY